MNAVLNDELKRDFLKRGFTRRSLGRIAAVMTAGAALPFYNEPALAQLSKVDAPPDSVFINANENPLGPCVEAREAAHSMIQYGGRYRYSEGDKVQALMAEQAGVKREYVRIYPGSSGPLHQSALAFTSPSRPFVTADPGYEAPMNAARFIGSEVVRVPLLKEKGYAHDVKAMAAVKNAGLIYICNPNNPTGTVTPKSDIEWLVANKPEGAIILIDEAYTHLSNEPFNTDLIAKDKDVVILRTFSKIYGMAGLRAGAAIGRPDLLQKIHSWSSTMMPITGMAAASASLQVKNLVPERRKIIADIREDVFSFMEKKNISYVKSVSNCFMVDTKRDGREVQQAMAKEKVIIGRVWPAWPTHVRVSVGNQEEMAKFKAALLKVMS